MFYIFKCFFTALHEPNIPTNIPISINNNDAKYNQYIDIYDVISEWNDCKDVLSAFLKMYQILEYIVYRKELHLGGAQRLAESLLYMLLDILEWCSRLPEGHLIVKDSDATAEKRTTRKKKRSQSH